MALHIANFNLFHVRVGLKAPFKTALRTVHAIESAVVCISCDDGSVGWGEAAPTAAITGETLPSIEAAILEYIRPALMGLDITQFDTVMERLHGCIVGNTSAKAAVDMALYDLFAQRCGLPLYQLLGGAGAVPETDLTISLNPAGQMAEDSRRAVESGYRILKLKVGNQGREDVARVEAVRREVGPHIALRVDANQGWEARQAVRAIRAMEDKGLDIQLVEQPVKARDIDGMAFVTAHVATPILADESVFSAEDALVLIRRRAADLLNLKLMKTGGIYKALHICAVAETCGVQCMMGCMLEGRLAVSAAAHLAGAKRVITMADLDGPGLCSEDPYEGGPLFEGPRISLPNTPGLGITGVRQTA